MGEMSREKNGKKKTNKKSVTPKLGGLMVLGSQLVLCCWFVMWVGVFFEFL